MTRRTRRKTEHGKMTEKPTVRIGKKGPTCILTKEVSKQVEKRGIVKINLLRTALVSEEAEQIAQKVATDTGSEIVELRGHTFTLSKRKKS